MDSRQKPSKNEDDKATLEKENNGNVAEEHFPISARAKQSSKEIVLNSSSETIKRVGIGTSLNETSTIGNEITNETSKCTSSENLKSFNEMCIKQTSKEASKSKTNVVTANGIEEHTESGANISDKNRTVFPNNKPDRGQGHKDNGHRTRPCRQCVSPIVTGNCVQNIGNKLPAKTTERYETEADLIPECHSLSSISEYDESYEDLQVTQKLLEDDVIVEDDPIQTMLNNAQIDKQISKHTVAQSEENRRYKFRRIASLAPALESKPPSYMWLALFTILFNFVIGLIALVIAMQSDHEYWKENIIRAKKLGRVVKLMCILGISTTCLTVIVISIVFSSPNKN